MVIAALTIDTPDRNSTTGLPSSRPMVNTVPRMVSSRRSSVAAFRASSSGAKAEITAVRAGGSWAQAGLAMTRAAHRTVRRKMRIRWAVLVRARSHTA